MWKRMISLLVVATMLTTLVPAAVFADEVDTAAGTAELAGEPTTVPDASEKQEPPVDEGDASGTPDTPINTNDADKQQPEQGGDNQPSVDDGTGESGTPDNTDNTNTTDDPNKQQPEQGGDELPPADDGEGDIDEPENTQDPENPNEQEDDSLLADEEQGEEDMELLGEELLVDEDDAVEVLISHIQDLPDAAAVEWGDFYAVETIGSVIEEKGDEFKQRITNYDKLEAAREVLATIALNKVNAAILIDTWKGQTEIKEADAYAQAIENSTYIIKADKWKNVAGALTELGKKTEKYAKAEAYIPISGGAEGEVTDFETLQDALNAVKNNETITLKNHVYITKTLVASRDITYTIDTKALSITIAGGAIFNQYVITPMLKVSAGNVTINGGGKIENKAGNIIYELSNGIIAVDNASLTLDKLYVTLASADSDKTNCSALQVTNAGTLTVQGGVITAKNTANSTFRGIDASGSTVSIDVGENTGGGAFVDANCGVYLGNKTSLSVVSSHIKSINNAIKSDSTTRDVTVSVSGNYSRITTTSTTAGMYAVDVPCCDKLSIKDTQITSKSSGLYVGIGTYTLDKVTLSAASLAVDSTDKYDSRKTSNILNVEIKNSNISATDATAIAVRGSIYKGAQLTIEKTAITSKSLAIYAGGNHGLDTVNINDCNITNSKSDYDTVAVRISMCKKLTISGSTITSESESPAISVMCGTVTLTNVTVDANGTAFYAEAHKIAEGDTPALNISITGGTYTSATGNVLEYGYFANSTTSDVSFAMHVKDATLIAKTGGKKHFYRTGSEDVTPTVENIVTQPWAGENDIPLASGQHILNVQDISSNETKKPNRSYVRTSMLGILGEMVEEELRFANTNTVYTNATEALVIKGGTKLKLQGETELTVKSITAYGQIEAESNVKITTADKLYIAYTKDANSGAEYAGSLEMNAGTQLQNGTTVEIAGYYDSENEMWRYGYVTLGNKRVIGGATDAQKPLFALKDDAVMQVSTKEVEDGGGTKRVTVYKVLQGSVEIANNGTTGEFDIGEDYLDIADDATVSAANGVTVKESEHITGKILYPGQVELIERVKELEAYGAPKSLTWQQYNMVKSAIEAKEVVEANKHEAAVEDELETLKAYEDVYLYRYIETRPDLLHAVNEYNTIEIGGDPSPTFAWTFAQGENAVPEDVSGLANSKFELTSELDADTDASLFTLANNTLAVNGDAKGYDTAIVLLRLTEKTGDKKRTSLPASITFTAMPNSKDATLVKIALESYTHTTNLKHSSQVVDIPVLYAFHTQVDYDINPRGYRVTAVKWAEEESNTRALASVYNVEHIGKSGATQAHITLTPKKDEAGKALLAKNKTYTGTLIFTVQKSTENSYDLPATAPLSVKVTDVGAKVTVKLATLDAFDNKVSATTDETYPYSYNAVPVTFSGTNAKDVESLSIQSDNTDILYTYDDEQQQISVKSKEPLTKCTLKPIITVHFTSESGFVPVTLSKKVRDNDVGTVTLKVAMGTPAVKLQKTSATISGEKDAEVMVNVITSNKKLVFDPQSITGVEARELVKVNNKSEWETSETVQASYADGAITLKLLKAFNEAQKSIKLSLNVSFAGTQNKKALSFTLSKKAFGLKLGKTSVTFSNQLKTNSATVPLTMTPDSEFVTLTKVAYTQGGTTTDYMQGANNSITVNGIEFSCVNSKALSVQSSSTELVKGNQKYSLYFDKGDEAKPLTLTVKVEEKYPTVTLSKSSVNVNTTFSDSATVKLQYSDGILTQRQVTLTPSSENVTATYNEQTGEITVRLSENAKSSESVQVQIAVDANLSPNQKPLKLTVKKVTKPIAMKVSIKGKLDTLDPKSTVTATVTFNGTAGSITPKTLAQQLNLTVKHFALTDNKGDLALSSYSVDSKGNPVLTIGWKKHDYSQRAGKRIAELTLTHSENGLTISNGKATVTAAESKVKATAQTVTLHQALLYSPMPIKLDAGGLTITGVALSKPSSAYVVAKSASGYVIRYNSDAPFGKGKWKAKDTLTLKVSVAGSDKVFSVKLPIVNVK